MKMSVDTPSHKEYNVFDLDSGYMLGGVQFVDEEGGEYHQYNFKTGQVDKKNGNIKVFHKKDIVEFPE